jgi:hypothetical protein
VTLGMGGSRGFHRDQTLLQYSPLCSRGHVGAAQPAVGRGICRLLLCLREWRGTPLHFRRSSTPRVASSDPSSGHSFKPICPGTGSAGPNSSSAGSSRSCTSSFRRHEPRCFSTARPVGGGRTASRTCTVRTRCAIIKTWTRPFIMFVSEPIVLWCSLLSGFSDALIFTFLEAFTPGKWYYETRTMLYRSRLTHSG